MQRYVRHWKIGQKKTPSATKAFIPLAFPPGETCQLDWSEEFVELGGVARKIKVGHFRLSYSRKMLVIAYPCETQEMVLDAHNRAFAFLAAFLCVWSMTMAIRCEELAGRPHPSQKTRTIAECFSEEQPLLRPITTPFDGYVAHLLRVSSTCLVRLDRNNYSAPAEWAGQVVSVRVTADRLRLVADGNLIAEHARCFSRDKFIFNPWHLCPRGYYLPVLERKPGALRHGAPFQEWDLPVPIKVVRDQLLKQPKGDKAFVDVLLMAKEAGVEAMETACELTLEAGIINASVVINELRRLLEPPRVKTLTVVEGLSLRDGPVADCSRYDSLLSGRYVH